MPKDKETWTISIGGINGFGGFCPGWTENAYPFYGNKNQASAMTDINLIDPNVLTQGPGIANLVSGSHVGELGENLIVAILKHVTSTNVSYACSADKVFKLSATNVLDGDFPLSITGGTYQVATDLVYYKSEVFVFWNDTGTEGEIAKVDIGTPAIDVDWGSTTPTGAAHLQDAPHYGIVGGDDVMYYTNGIYVGSYNGTTLNPTHLDFWTNAQTVSVTWNNNRVKVAVNRPNVSGSNFNQSGIYTWNGVSSSWEGDPIEVNGELGALYTKNGITFVWWKDSISTGGYCFGYISGLQVELLARYSGSLPNQAQVSEYEGHISWLSSEKLMVWGAKDANCEVKMFPYMSAKHSTAIGGFAAPFGTPLIASHQYATFTADKDTDIITSAAHGLVDDDTIRLTGADLPAGLSTATTYYVIEATTNTFQLSASEGGTKINITDAGTPPHTWHQYSLGKASGYSIGARYSTMAFNVSGVDFKSQIDLIMVEFEPLALGAKCDFTLTYNKAASTQELTQIAYSTTDASTRRKILNRSYQVEDFRLDLSWAEGSVTNPVKIRNIFIKGHFVRAN